VQEIHEERSLIWYNLDMKIFQQIEIPEAVAYAMEGGQALHLHRIIANKAKAPSCFIRAVNKGENIAHLFDQDVERLRKTALALGVRVILIEREGCPKQHIDLCGAPLKKAIKLCE
jgi:hypothetical protein